MGCSPHGTWIPSGRSLTFMPETTAPYLPDFDPPAPATIDDGADGKGQSAQVVRHISLTQLEALHATTMEDGEDLQTREGCSTIMGDEDPSQSEGTA